MPVWMEILVDLTGYAGFLVIARFNRSADRTASGNAGAA
jgi:hypothetical protein